MKKLALTIAIIFGLGIGVYAQGGLFGYGAVSDEEYYGASASDRTSTTPLLSLPNNHGGITDQTGDAPLGSGALLLIGFGAAYTLKKKRKKTTD